MPSRYHVFLSHSSADKPAVEKIARKLREAGIEPFLDKWHLVPGDPWQEALENALDQSSTCAVFLGPGDLGPWHNEEMRTVLDQLKAGETSAVGQVETAAATGLGGIGKTQLASELVHRYGQFFAGGVFWMSFADAAAVPIEVADCGRSLNLLSGFDALTLEQQVRLVEEAWRSPLPRLLVFDNCEEEELLRRWRPRFGSARVLVTSRRPEWDPSLGVKTVPLTTLPRPASIELLRRFRPDVPEAEPALNDIAGELGDLPLALHLAGSFLRNYCSSSHGQPAVYLEALRQKDLVDHPSLQGHGSVRLPTDHANHVGRTFALSFERLDPANPVDVLASELLARAAWFAPGEPIPRSLLLKTAPKTGEDLTGDLLAEDALHRPTDLGLLEPNDRNDLLMHRLVAAWARRVAGGDRARMAVEETLLEEAKRINEIRNPALLMAWQPHLRAITDRSMEREDRTAARLCDELGLHLWLAGDYSGARSYLERAIAVHAAVSGPEHEDLAHSLNVMGAILNYLKNFQAARPYLERALAIRERVLGPDHPDTAQSLNDLGFLLDGEEDYEGARLHHERALEIRENVLGPEHPDTARSLSNLGGLLINQEDFERARLYFERVIAIEEKALGPEHPDTAIGFSNLGGLLESQGDLKGARLYYEEALRIQEKALGPEHPHTARSLINLGTLYLDQESFAKARRYLEPALEILKARLGPNHPDTQKARRHVGHLPGARRLKKQPPKKKS